MNCQDTNIIEFAKYLPRDISADEASMKPKGCQKKAEIIRFNPRIMLSADGHSIIFNF